MLGLEADARGHRWSVLFTLDDHGVPGADVNVDGRLFARVRPIPGGRELLLVVADTVSAREQVGFASVSHAGLGGARRQRMLRFGAVFHGTSSRICLQAWSHYADVALDLLKVLDVWAAHADPAVRAAVTAAAARWTHAFDAVIACLAGS